MYLYNFAWRRWPTGRGVVMLPMFLSAYAESFYMILMLSIHQCTAHNVVQNKYRTVAPWVPSRGGGCKPPDKRLTTKDKCVHQHAVRASHRHVLPARALHNHAKTARAFPKHVCTARAWHKHADSALCIVRACTTPHHGRCGVTQ